MPPITAEESADAFAQILETFKASGKPLNLLFQRCELLQQGCLVVAGLNQLQARQAVGYEASAIEV